MGKKGENGKKKGGKKEIFHLSAAPTPRSPQPPLFGLPALQGEFLRSFLLLLGEKEKKGKN